jgi:hypothetical protein
MVRDPVRSPAAELAPAVHCTEPLPLPKVGVSCSQDALLDAVHAHPAPAVMTIRPEPPEEGTFTRAELAETLNCAQDPLPSPAGDCCTVWRAPPGSVISAERAALPVFAATW